MYGDILLNVYTEETADLRMSHVTSHLCMSHVTSHLCMSHKSICVCACVCTHTPKSYTCVCYSGIQICRCVCTNNTHAYYFGIQICHHCNYFSLDSFFPVNETGNIFVANLQGISVLGYPNSLRIRVPRQRYIYRVTHHQEIMYV